MNIVITGGSRGIGRAIAEIFAANGFEVAVAGRTSADLERMQEDFAQRFPTARLLAFQADLSQQSGVLAFAEAVQQRWTDIDVLVNNAGIFQPGKLLEDADGVLEKMMNLNFWSAYHLTRLLAPAMVRVGKGHIFNIGSVASKAAYPNSGAYGVTKFAMLGFSKALRMEVRGSGVKVTDVLPGSTWTSSWEGVEMDPARLLAATDVAKAVFSAWSMGPSGMVEELIIRPQLGDL